jgi:hypothetical protein
MIVAKMHVAGVRLQALEVPMVYPVAEKGKVHS